jgi:hypothetical protein
MLQVATRMEWALPQKPSLRVLWADAAGAEVRLLRVRAEDRGRRVWVLCRAGGTERRGASSGRVMECYSCPAVEGLEVGDGCGLLRIGELYS